MLTTSQRQADKYLAQCMRERAKERAKKLKEHGPAMLKVLQEIMTGQLQGNVDLDAPRFQMARSIINDITGVYEPRTVETPWKDVVKRLLDEFRASTHLGYGEHKHLFASNHKGNGYFLVHNLGMVLDRKAFKEIVGEAKKEQLVPPYFIYGVIASYMGPGIEFIQIDVE